MKYVFLILLLSSCTKQSDNVRLEVDKTQFINLIYESCLFGFESNKIRQSVCLEYSNSIELQILRQLGSK
jgi:hypothetical protein